MDNNNGSSSQGGGLAIEADDWRSSLSADSQQRIVNKIMDTTKRHLPLSGEDGSHELKKISVRFEEKIYTAALSQSDYLQKISLKMLTMETKPENTMATSLQSQFSEGSSGMQPQDTNQGQLISEDIQSNILHAGVQSSTSSSSALPQASGPQQQQPIASLDSTTQTANTNGDDRQEEAYQKIEIMKEMYLSELSEMYQKIATYLNLHISPPEQPKSDQLEKLKMFKTMLERLIAVLQIGKSNISPGLKEKLNLYEKQIVNCINANRPRKPVSLPHGQLPPPHMRSQTQITRVQSHENQMNPQLQSMNLQSSVLTMPQNNMTGLQQNNITGLQQNNMTGLQQNPVSSLSEVTTVQQNMMNPLQPISNMDPGQASLDSLAHTGHTNGADWQEDAYQKVFGVAMDTNNWRPPPQGGEPAAMDTGDWRSQLQADSRQRIVNKIMDTLKRHLPFSSQEGLHELKKIAVRFEEKIYTAATSQLDYLRKISLKMLTMEAKSQNTMANPIQCNSASNSVSSLSGVTTAQQDMMNPFQPSSNMDPGQGTTMNSLQQVPLGSMQQTSVSAPQQPNMTGLSSQSGINMLQGTMNPLILHSQQREQQMYHNQLKQQYQQRQMQQQLIQKQQIIQQQQLPQSKPQVLELSPADQLPQLYQISVVKDVNMNVASSQNGSTVPQANIVDNIHLKQDQEQEISQNQLKQPYQQLQMQQQWMKKQLMLQETQLLQIQQLQKLSKLQLHHIYVIYLIFLTILLPAAFFWSGY